MRRSGGNIDGSLDNVFVDLPPGFVGNPNAVPKCTAEEFAHKPIQCPPQSQVGIVHLHLAAPSGAEYYTSADELLPLYNLEPRYGNVAELGFPNASSEDATTVRVVAGPRTDGDFGITTAARQIPTGLPLISQMATLWGVPWARHHDRWRMPLGGGNEDGAGYDAGLPPEDQTGYDPSWGEVRPFLTQETDCAGPQHSTLKVDSYQHSGAFTSGGGPDPSDPDWKTYTSPLPATTGCEKLGFSPSLEIETTSRQADSPTGLSVALEIPQNDHLPLAQPELGASQAEVNDYLAAAEDRWRSDQGLATPQLKDVTVDLPWGMSVNPSSADGQQACTAAEIGLTSSSPIRFDDSDPNDGAGNDCPAAAEIGTVKVETSLLDEADWPRGEVYLAEQGNRPGGVNPFGSLLAIYIVAESPERGLIIKLAGKVHPDPLTGQLETTFLNNPELPFDRLEMRLKGGDRAPLSNPPVCGIFSATSELASRADPLNPVVLPEAYPIDQGPGGGPCLSGDPARPAGLADLGSRPFGPGFAAGVIDPVAGASSPFALRLTRPDGHQEVSSLDLDMPPGLTAKLAGVPYCSEATLASISSLPGTGAGELTTPSCPAASQIGVATVGAGSGPSPFYARTGRAYLAGPYRGAPLSIAVVTPALAGPFDLGSVVVRNRVLVDPDDAQAHVVSDPLPHILFGIPLRLRDIRVDVDRPGFMRTPTSCNPTSVGGVAGGINGAVARLSNRFQVGGCRQLGFKPKLRLRLQGGTKRGEHPALRAVLSARPGDANIARVSVALPHSEFLAQEHIRTICTRVQFAADRCPEGSIYGQVRAFSPLLDKPLEGPAYLRSSSNPLPDLVLALRGQVDLDLAGRVDSVNGGIRTTFALVPDAPVTRFVLSMKGGKKGLLVNSQDLCASPHRAQVSIEGQNGKSANQRSVLRSECGKKKKGKRSS